MAARVAGASADPVAWEVSYKKPGPWPISKPPLVLQTWFPVDAPLPRARLGRLRKMLHYAVVFFIIAIIAAVLGFGGIAAGAAGIAKVLFFVFLILALITFLRRA